MFISFDFLKTLPARQILSGTAEMLKHGLIADAGYWEALKNSDLTQPTPELIYHSIGIKNKVVIEDPTEKGIRKALKFWAYSRSRRGKPTLLLTIKIH